MAYPFESANISARGRGSSARTALAAVLLCVLASGCNPETIDGYFTTMKAGDADPFSIPPVMPPLSIPHGILGGHFDMETSSPASGSNPFPVGSGNVTYHVHEYDKVNQTTTVDLFNISNVPNKNPGAPYCTGNSFNQLNASFQGGKRFHLIVVNAPINRGGILTINGGAPMRVTQFQADNQATLAGGARLPIYTIGTPTEPGDRQLTGLKVAFDPQVLAKRLLNPTSPTNCVIPNVAGPSGEYRDGALVIQAVDIGAFKLGTNGAATSDGGLLWEGIVFNHYETEEEGHESNLCSKDLLGL